MAVKLANKAALDQFQELLQGLPLDRWQQSMVMTNFKNLPAKQIQRHAQSIVDAIKGLRLASSKFRALKSKIAKAAGSKKTYFPMPIDEPQLVVVQGQVMSELEALTEAVKAGTIKGKSGGGSKELASD